MDTPSRVRGVILAGGDSVRFGDRDKALAEVDDQPMLCRVADAIRTATGVPPVIAVATDARRETYDDVLDEADFVIDSPAYAGPLGGLVAAVEYVTEDWVFACACDMPYLDPLTIQWLAARRECVDAVVPIANDIAQPLHAWYRRKAVLATIEGGGVDTFQALVERLEAEQVTVSEATADVSLADSLRNVNRPADLERN